MLLPTTEFIFHWGITSLEFFDFWRYRCVESNHFVHTLPNGPNLRSESGPPRLYSLNWGCPICNLFQFTSVIFFGKLKFYVLSDLIFSNNLIKNSDDLIFFHRFFTTQKAFDAGYTYLN